MNGKSKIDSNVEILRDFIKRVFTLGRDTVVVIEDEAEKLIKRLVEKGQLTEDEGRRMVDELLSKLRKDSQELVDSVESRVRQTIGPIIPARSDLDELRRQVSELASRVDQLIQQRSAIPTEPEQPEQQEPPEQPKDS